MKRLRYAQALANCAALITQCAARLLCVLCCLLWLARGTGADEAPTEYQVKAAFLFNFAKFTEWPANCFAQENSPFIIGVMGDDPFGSHLDKAVDGKALESHKIVVKRWKKMDDMQPCHLLFIARSEKERVAKIAERTGKSNTLLIADSEGTLQRGAMINFLMEEKKVRFEINPDAAERADLKISAKLLQLATRVVHR